MTKVLKLINASTGGDIIMDDFTVVVAGYTGRDENAVQHHIDELAAIGIAPPPEVPMFYIMPETVISTTDQYNVSGTFTSGEVEPVYIRYRGKYYLGVGSDHTDRELESKDIGESKRVCPKPVSIYVLPFGSPAEMDLDQYIASCWVDGSLYQHGKLNNLRTPMNLLTLMEKRLSIGKGDYVCLGGTLSLIDGKFIPGEKWEIQIETADGQKLSHKYLINAD